MGLCCDKAILCRDIVGQDGTFFYHGRVGQARSFLSPQNISIS